MTFLSRRILIWISAGLTLMPLGIFTGYLSYKAFKEPYFFKNAPNLDSTPKTAEKIYRIEGKVKLNPLNPEDYPEVRGAIWYRVVSERRPSLASAWQRDATRAVANERVNEFEIGGQTVRVGLLSRMALPLIRVERIVDDFHRLAIEYKQAPTILRAIGTYKNGRIEDGLFDRLVVLEPNQMEDVVQAMIQKSYHKGIFLGGISAIFLGLTGAVIPLLRRMRQRPSSSLGQPFRSEIA